MRFLEADILFDAGSAQFVVNDIPAVKNGTILKAEMAENAIEAATISKALLDQINDDKSTSNNSDHMN